MNATIIYHDYRVWDRKWLHLIQGMFHEFVEGCSVEGTFNKYLKQYSLSYMHYMISICVPFPLTEKDFPGSFHPMYSPCTTSVCCMMINCTFINENELVWLIYSYTSCEYGVLLHTLFKCCVRKLKLLSTSDICSWSVSHTFFMVSPPFTNVLHIATSTPCFSINSSCSSSKYTSSLLLRVL